jgi:hypothetical protein
METLLALTWSYLLNPGTHHVPVCVMGVVPRSCAARVDVMAEYVCTYPLQAP